METVEWDDVQALVLNGYPKLTKSAFLLWRFVPDQQIAAKRWIADMTNRLMRADGLEDDSDAEPGSVATPVNLPALKNLHNKTSHTHSITAVNLALTATGLTALGVAGGELAFFATEFQEGMAPAPANGQPFSRRSSALGDVDANSPVQWEWGGWENPPIDGVLLLYASTPQALERLVAHELTAMQGAANPVRPQSIPDGDPPVLKSWIDRDKPREHFGFRDGISQPLIKGTPAANEASAKQTQISVVNPGEFLLGYLNERNARVTFAHQARGEHTDLQDRDLGRNGTYLVFRQLEQDVPAFNAFVASTAERLHGTADTMAQDQVAAQLLGRRRNGDPLIRPPADSTSGNEPRNDFLYYFEDRAGLQCPVGAHVRRANPRDALGPDPETALDLSRMHRIIRRSRLYGERLLPDSTQNTTDTATEKRGLHFICLNSDIAGQFEMIQHTWMNNEHFDRLYDETDPLSHYRGPNRMTIQSRPANVRLTDLPRFVTVRGGAYFFMPGITALRALAQ